VVSGVVIIPFFGLLSEYAPSYGRELKEVSHEYDDWETAKEIGKVDGLDFSRFALIIDNCVGDQHTEPVNDRNDLICLELLYTRLNVGSLIFLGQHVSTVEK
jgi:hypothetical protein